MKTIVVWLPLASLFLFPFSFSVLLIVFASVIFPPSGIIYGLLAEALYFTSMATSYPYALMIGIGISIGGFFLSRFIRTHLWS